MGLSGSKESKVPAVKAKQTPEERARAGMPELDAPRPTCLRDKEDLATMQMMTEIFCMRQVDSGHAAAGNIRSVLTPEDAAAGKAADAAGGFETTVLPVDGDGYVQSFRVQDGPEQTAAALEFFETHGVVVFADVLTPDQARCSVDDVWEFITRHVPTAKRDDPTTWDKWMSLANLGFLGQTVALGPQLCDNRQNPLVHQAFASILGSEELVVNVGRLSFMRPTKGVRVRRSATTDRPGSGGSDGGSDGDEGCAGGGGGRDSGGKVGEPEASASADVDGALAARCGDDERKDVTPPTEGKVAAPPDDAAAPTGAGGGAGAGDASKEGEQAGGEWAVVDKPEWKTAASWIHVDMSPFTGGVTGFSWRLRDWTANRGYGPDGNRMRYALQGVLALDDCGPADGGFVCVPGMWRNMRAWAATRPHLFKPNDYNTCGSLRIPTDDPMLAGVQRVPLRAGSLVIWSSATPHANFPNDSSHPRIVEYIRMMRADEKGLEPLFRDESLLPEGFRLTPLGRRLHGFAPWPRGKDEGRDSTGAASA